MSTSAKAKASNKNERFIYQDDELIEKPFNWGQLRRLFGYMKPYTKQLMPVIVMMILGTLTRLGVPALVILAIDEAIAPEQGETSVPKLITIASIMLVLYVIQWASIRTGSNIRISLGKKLFMISEIIYSSIFKS